MKKREENYTYIGRNQRTRIDSSPYCEIEFSCTSESSSCILCV